jgi:2-oxoglutarate ferredoxin oxidoreductase subunit gamma
MTRTEIKLAGFGGQGIVLAGFILGKAISIYDKQNAVLTQAYGPEARGGACSADVVTSDSDIDFPEVTIPNIIVIMSQEAFTKFAPNIRKRGHLLIDEDLVTVDEKLIPENVKIFSIPATRFAEELGRKMLGFFTAITNTPTLEAIKRSLLGSVPKGTEELNMSAMMKGYDYGLEQLKLAKSKKNSNNSSTPDKKDK